MGKASRNRAARNITAVRRELIKETWEPERPHNWPRGHVDVKLTGDDQLECILVEIHGVKHYLHTTTAKELEKMLHERVEEWQTIHGRMPVEPIEGPADERVDFSKFCMVVISVHDSDGAKEFVYERPQTLLPPLGAATGEDLMRLSDFPSDRVLEEEAFNIFADLKRRMVISNAANPPTIGVVRSRQQAETMLGAFGVRRLRVL